MAKYKIVFDKNGCIGCGTCAAICPENWEMSGDKAIPKKTELDSLDCNQEAADACPVNVIKIEKV
jgi:ferredoxin